MNIHGKITWITGASSGIGEALAKEFFRQGATIILSARSVDKLSRLKITFDSHEPGRCYVVPFDITSKEEIEKAAEQVKQIVNRVDILVNNAGVSQRSLALDTDICVDRALFELNFFGAVGITKSILPWMIERGGGHIVVVSSMAGKFGFRLRSSYSASKHALQGFFETLRAEVYDKNVRVTLICPGRIRTDISVNSLTGDGKNYGKMDAGQEHGVSAERCAKKIVRSVKCNRKEVFIGNKEVLLLTIKRICPYLYYRIVNRVSPT
jgi:short-subunit dehydrogenase